MSHENLKPVQKSITTQKRYKCIYDMNRKENLDYPTGLFNDPTFLIVIMQNRNCQKSKDVGMFQTLLLHCSLIFVQFLDFPVFYFDNATIFRDQFIALKTVFSKG